MPSINSDHFVVPPDSLACFSCFDCQKKYWNLQSMVFHKIMYAHISVTFTEL